MHSSHNTNTSPVNLSGNDRRSAALLRGLGGQLVVQVFLAAAILSVIATSAQVFAQYKQEQSELSNVVPVVEQSFGIGFEEALWEYNFQLAEALLEGVFNKPSVEYAKITTAEKKVIELGQPDESLNIEDLRLEHIGGDGQSTFVGTLTVGLSARAVHKQLYAQTGILLLSNFAKALVTALIIFAIFEHNVGRHLRRVAQHVSRSPWNLAENKIELDRAERSQPDDLDYIVDAIETATHRSQSDFSRLEREICQRLETELQLKECTRALENANREQAEFTYAISHDLKSPTNTIKMLVGELLLLEQDQISAEGQGILQDMDRTTDRMTKMIEDVLEYACTVEKQAVFENVDLNALLKDVCEQLGKEIRDSDADIRFADLPMLRGDREQLRILLHSMVSNAIKFRTSGQPPIVSIKAARQHGRHILRVCDNGIGIAPEHRNRIFGLFQRLHSHRAYQGSGVGLALCKRIANNHAGYIKVRSAVQRGTCFEITIGNKINET